MAMHPLIATLGDAFRYDALNTSTSDLRLIEIVPTRDVLEPVFCRVHTYGVDTCPAYEALSYAWGDDTTTDFIHLLSSSSGGFYRIAANLYSALINLRKCRAGQAENQRMLIWIDALCIDQQNLEERNDQVQRMNSIYRKAKKVVIYLGDYDDPSDSRLQFASDIWGVESVERGTYSLTLAALTIATCLSSMVQVADDDEIKRTVQASVSLDQSSPLSNRQAWAHLSRLFNRPWFERLWIIQELGVSQEATALFGAIAIPWSILEDTAAFILRPHHSIPGPILKFFPLMRAHRVTQVALNNTPDVEATNLLTILRHTQKAQCSDPRDKLYAVLGVSDDFNDLTINYSKPFQNVYRHWAILRILRTKSLDVLTACADSSRTGELPSWVPDFRRSWAHDRALWRLVHRLYQDSDSNLQKDHMLIPSELNDWTFEGLFSADHLQLQIDGLQIGIVTSLSESGDAVTSLGDPTHLTSRLFTIISCLENWYQAQLQELKVIPLSVDATLKPLINNILRKSLFFPRFEILYTQYNLWRDANRHNEKIPLSVPDLRGFEASLFSFVHGCQFIALSTGIFGVVAENCHCQPDDEIYLLKGGLTPFVLRRSPAGHRLITPCFVSGYTNVNVLRPLAPDSAPAELTKLVIE